MSLVKNTKPCVSCGHVQGYVGKQSQIDTLLSKNGGKCPRCINPARKPVSDLVGPVAAREVIFRVFSNGGSRNACS